MTTRKPPDLAQIRPTAELDHPSIRHSPASGRPGQVGAERPPHQSQRSRTLRPRTLRRRARPREPGEGWSLGAKLAAFAGGLFALTGIGIAALFFIVSPTDLVRNELIRQVKANTGRDLQINGRSRFLFYPSLGVSLGDIVLSGPPDMTAEPTLTARRLDLKVGLLPLLQQRVRIEHAGLVEPVVNLQVDSQGRQNWQFSDVSKPSDSQRIRVAQISRGLGSLSDAQPAGGNFLRAAAPGTAGQFITNLELRSLALKKAVIQYRDDRDGSRHQLRNLDLQINGRRISDPLEANGRLVWHGEPVSFRIRLDTLAQLLAGQDAGVRISADGQPVATGFDGTVKVAKKISVAGQTRASGTSLASLSRWLGLELPNAGPLGGFSVSGQLVGDPDSISLNGAELRLGETKGSGTILLALRPKRPYVSADLKWTELDIDRLSAAFADSRAIGHAQPRPVSLTGPATQSTPRQQAPQSIEDLLRRSQPPGEGGGAGRFAPQVRGYTNRNEWSAAPIDAALLGAIDAKARLRFDGLRAGGLRIGRAVTRLDLSNAVARLDIDDLELYQGAGKGVITVRAANAKTTTDGVSVGANLRVEKISTNSLLGDAAGFQRLEGRGDLTFVASSTGNSQKAIAEGLNGSASFTVQDGAITGWNIGRILQDVGRGKLSGLNSDPAEKTEFSELSASFNIVRGTATTNDLKLISQVLVMNGSGDVGIAARNLDLALRPQLASATDGRNGPAGAGMVRGIAIPVRFKGPWNDPRVLPDVGGLTTNPGQLIDRARELGGQTQGQSIGDIVRGVLGNENDERSRDSGRGGKDPKEILKQFWK